MPSHTRRTWGLGSVGAVALVGLSSCGGDDCRNCFNYVGNRYSTEVSFGLVAGNFANNGFNSIVTSSAIDNGLQPNPGNLKVYLASGPLTYAAPVLIPDGNDPVYLSAADLTADHLLDVVSANAQDGSLAVFFNNAQNPGMFSSPLVLKSPGASQLAIADMNGDGLPDLISADFNVSLFIQGPPGIVAGGPSNFENPISLYSGGANWVAAGDLNHDGSPDIALTDNVGVKLLFHSGAAAATTFAAPVAIYNESSTAAIFGGNLIAIADVNGDGYNDLIITDPGPASGSAPFVAVLLQNAASPGTFLAPVTYATATGSRAQSIQVTDVNGDGHPDIVIGGSAAVSVLLNDASSPGTFAAAANYAVTNANQIAIADVNGDGLLDIVVATGASTALVNGVYTNQPGVLLQNSSAPGTFAVLQNL